MGRLRKRFNEKGRQCTVDFEIPKHQEENVMIDMRIDEEKYDASNPLVISGQKKKAVKIPSKAPAVVKKPLSKKQKKKLQNILKKKNKKIQRDDLLLKLSQVQAKPQELNFLTSTTEMQTCGLKRSTDETFLIEEKTSKISNNRGSRKKSLLPPKKKFKLAPNVVNFEESSSESDVDSCNEQFESEIICIGKNSMERQGTEVDADDLPISKNDNHLKHDTLSALINESEENNHPPLSIPCDFIHSSPGFILRENESTVQSAELLTDDLYSHGAERLSEKTGALQTLIQKKEQSKQDQNCLILEKVDVPWGDTDIQNTNSAHSENPNERNIASLQSGVSSKTESNDASLSELSSRNALGSESVERTERVPAVFIPLNRLPEIQAARENLPIFCEEQSIMEAVRENSVVVIHGETGSGKTTQVPQFLYEAGFTQNKKLIGITEPRRIAAIAMAARVGVEMNKPEVVSYHIRYEKTVDDNTEIKFMTDGVLLKEIRHDFFLSRYSVIIIDEAHERSVFSDVLIGLLSRIVPLREKKGDPLKLIIMSATIRVQDFTENPKLFKVQPVLIRLDSRQYKVQVHFNIRTPEDYVDAAYRKVCKIHQQLPPGAILVFLTGEKEVTKLCKLLRKTFPFREDINLKHKEEKHIPDSSPLINKRKKKEKKDDAGSFSHSFCTLPTKIDLNDYSIEPFDIENLQHHLSDEEENSHITEPYIQKYEDFSPLYTLPLYSILPYEEQGKVFKPPPVGSRLCVVSTNVAETSITIPGLKYVVDSGKVKTKVYDKFSGGISKFCITWSSKASANQRAGRAGRTEGGHCYRLYSSAVFEHEFPDFSPPEIQRIPVDDVLLQMKALGIDRVVNFPFPSPPDNDSLKAAERRLVLLGALQNLQKGERYKDIEKWEYSAKITPLGRAMSCFPLSPRYAKMLLLSYKHSCIPYIVAIVCAMTVPEVFLCLSNEGNPSENLDEEEKMLWKGVKKIGAGKGKSLQLGDSMVLLRAVALYEESKSKVQFCVRNGIRHKAMVEIRKMCVQLLREMNRAFQDLSLPLALRIDPPNDDQVEKIRKIITTGFTDHVARRVPAEDWEKDKSLKNAYKCLDLEEPVFIHPSSILFKELPEFVVYQEIVHTSKYYMKGIVEIDSEWLAGFSPSLCCFSEPLEDPPPAYDSEKDQIICSMNVTFGHWSWDLPTVIMEMPRGLLKYSWFCFFLLDGQICSFFKHYRAHLLSCPSVMLKSWAKLLPRTRYLLQAVIAKEVDSRKSLEKVWEKDPRYLLREYWEWLPEEKHMEIECKWPPR